jgi:hypothetical protein
VAGKTDAPASKHPDEPEMLRVSDQVEGREPADDHDKGGEMDEEAAHRRLGKRQLNTPSPGWPI